MNSKNVSFREILRILSRKEKTRLIAYGFGRVALNLLDVAALALVGIIGFLVANPGAKFHIYTSFKASGFLSITDVPLIASLSALLFVFKTIFSVTVSFQFASFISNLEAGYSGKYLRNQFSSPSINRNAPDAPNVQSILLTSLHDLVTGAIGSMSVILAEGSLLIFLVAGFILLNPFAAISVVAYLGTITFFLSRFIMPRVQKARAGDYENSRKVMRLVRDYLAIRREVVLQNANQNWLSGISDTKYLQILNASRGVALGNLPRNLIETSLIMGVFGFLAIVVLLSDISSQAMTIGVFLVGGLRMVAAVLPFQAAVATYRQALGSLRDALEGLGHSAAKTRSLPPLVPEISATPNLSVDVVKYDVPGSHFSLSEVKFDVPFGSKVAVVGPSGAGKSTLAELIIGFVSPTEGSVTLDGIQTSDVLSEHPKLFGYVPQRSHLIEGTLFENISLGSVNDAASQLKATEVLNFAGLGDMVSKLPNGLQEQLSPGHPNISGGELQRLGMARALFTSPRILVLDEATSALDAETENTLSVTLSNLRGSMTQIVIAHRLSTILDADLIIYLDGGEVLGMGEFASLSASVPGFKRALRLLSTGG